MNKIFLICASLCIVSLVAADKKDALVQEHGTSESATENFKTVFLVGFTLGSTPYTNLNYQEALEILEAQDDKNNILTNVTFEGYIEKKSPLSFTIPDFPQLSQLIKHTERMCEVNSTTSYSSVNTTLEYIKEQYKTYSRISARIK